MCVCVSVRECMCVCAHVCECEWLCVSAFEFFFLCVLFQKQKETRTNSYTHAYTYIYRHTYTDTHRFVGMRPNTFRNKHTVPPVPGTAFAHTPCVADITARSSLRIAHTHTHTHLHTHARTHAHTHKHTHPRPLCALRDISGCSSAFSSR